MTLVPCQKMDAGFTLIELLVVLAILAVMTAAVTVFVPNQSRRETRAFARELAGDLRDLRDQAVQRRAATQLWLDQTAGRVSIRASGLEQAVPTGVSLAFRPGAPSLLGDPPDHLAFYPDGSASGGEIVVSEGSFTITIRVGWADGRVSVDD